MTPAPEHAAVLISFLRDISLTILTDRSRLVSRAFLIAAESSFEILFSRLAHAIYQRNPSALARSDYSFTLEQISTYASIDEARNALVTLKIEALLRESVDEWGKWLKRMINISLDNVIDDWPTMREIFSRRNMLVHTDGRISKRYLDELSRSGMSVENMNIGESLSPSVEYLQTSLQRLVALEILLTFHVWSRLHKDQLDKASQWLAGNLDFLISRKMWYSVSLIANQFGNVQCQRTIKLNVQVNGWLARKKQEGLMSIKDDVSLWDVSALEPKYRLIKNLLLDSVKPEDLEEVAHKANFTRFEIATNPLFDNCRDAHHTSAIQPPEPE